MTDFKIKNMNKTKKNGKQNYLLYWYEIMIFITIFKHLYLSVPTTL